MFNTNNTNANTVYLKSNPINYSHMQPLIDTLLCPAQMRISHADCLPTLTVAFFTF